VRYPTSIVERLRIRLGTEEERPICVLPARLPRGQPSGAALPWRDLTTATLEELRFNSIAGWLPENEASALRDAFQCEINRLYLITEADDNA
jgi:hypothetical protein